MMLVFVAIRKVRGLTVNFVSKTEFLDLTCIPNVRTKLLEVKHSINDIRIKIKYPKSTSIDVGGLLYYNSRKKKYIFKTSHHDQLLTLFDQEIKTFHIYRPFMHHTIYNNNKETYNIKGHLSL